MNSDDLGYFVRIAEAMSLSGAARMTDTPKSSLSRALSRLEADIGARLFERGPNALRLTEAGQMLLPHARRVLDDLSEAKAALDGVTGQPRGILRVNAAMTFALGLVAPMLPEFLSRFPDLRVHLETENRVVDLARENVDVAIRVGAMPASDMRARKLGDIALWPCASPAYLVRHDAPKIPADLVNHILFGWSDQPTTWTFWDASGREYRAAVPVGSVVHEPAVLQVLIQNGAGIGRLPDFLARDAIEQGLLVRILPTFATEKVTAHAVYAVHRSLSSKVRVFIDALREHLALQTRIDPR
ncbi:MAG: LysR substrate-binding domain-containing protein [Gluconobacter cerinus]|uniref:LysR family transcriptional regulator n=1 Tax=Gluconobacter cerinus TaxID=38307 RepID=UPI0039E899A6